MRIYLLLPFTWPKKLELISNIIIIKFPYNARSDWLKLRALSQIRERVGDI